MDSAVPIFSRVNESGTVFISLERALSNSSWFAAQVPPEYIKDEFDRFKIWAGNIAAHRKGRRSLEYRLRDAAILKDEAHNLLTALHDSLQTSIVQERRRPWDELSDSESDSDSDTLSDDAEAQGDTELKQLLGSIKATITCLFRLSMSIRDPAPNDQSRSIITVDKSYFEEYDMLHVKAKYPGCPGYLVERLGRANSGRRQYLSYREEHHQKLAKDVDLIGLEAPRTEHSGNSTEATPMPKAQVDSFEVIDSDDALSQTSYATSCPLCDQRMAIRSLQRHVARHQEQLALFALPPNLGATEDDPQDEEHEVHVRWWQDEELSDVSDTLDADESAGEEEIPVGGSSLETPQNPVQELDAIALEFQNNLAPECEKFINDPPRGQVECDNLRKKLSQMILQEALLKVDDVQTFGDSYARLRRKELITEMQQLLNRMDNVLPAEPKESHDVEEAGEESLRKIEEEAGATVLEPSRMSEELHDAHPPPRSDVNAEPNRVILSSLHSMAAEIHNDKDTRPQLKGILRRPTEKFPEDPGPTLEAVAPLGRIEDIHPGDPWTKIDRKLVDPEALTEAEERFEVGPDSIYVKRVLRREEIQKLAERTREIRESGGELESGAILLSQHHDRPSSPPFSSRAAEDENASDSDEGLVMARSKKKGRMGKDPGELTQVPARLGSADNVSEATKRDWETASSKGKQVEVSAEGDSGSETTYSDTDPAGTYRDHELAWQRSRYRRDRKKQDG
ncbi:hypothetical protein DL767_004615 [Monosporascus sp. MG133]|nr:hypothetical protein DL767_004615 [Monosporascus sp. MG133]